MVLWFGFDFLRANEANQIVSAIIAILWGVGGVAALYTVANVMVESLSIKWRDLIQPYVFVGPGVAILTWFLFIPTLRTLYQSFFEVNSNSSTFVGLDNYVRAFTMR